MIARCLSCRPRRSGERGEEAGSGRTPESGVGGREQGQRTGGGGKDQDGKDAGRSTATGCRGRLGRRHPPGGIHRDVLFFHHQNCWNCGRKASETCSGCNIARYCGSFCQHKDWESHHRVCSQASTSLPATSSTSTPPRTTSDHSPSPSRTSALVDVKPIKIDMM
ncbi:Protein CBFA2T2 [Araneus ventricosus]|uniref:Protein CBFA2T2 n=1 Tax=Araneus ventricosus TaxID=182803 RepID=A0A4Y2FAD5_ARAVE|nr:Protein CBFA2T2 [Araneus ventricosus]